MNGDALRFEEIRVQRTPGFERGGFTVHGLSAGVNLIHGPNGSGKSTTARAISRLLWPAGNGTERVAISGRYRLGGEEWEVEVEGTRVTHRRSGVDAPPPLLPPAQDQERYHLSLHDLLQSRDVQFAQAVVRESAGGYDLRRAAEVLEPKTAVSRPRAALEELEEARAAYDRAVTTQGQLRGEEERLQELEQDWQAADEASRRLLVLDAALDHARAREAEARARAELERYPAGLGRVAGDEYDRLCGIRERLRRFSEEGEEAVAAREAAHELLERSAIPQEMQGDEILRGLESDLKALQEQERIASEAARGIASSAARVEAEAKAIDGLVEPERLVALEVPDMAAVAGFARRAGGAQARRSALEERLRALGEPSPAEDPGRLEEGVRCLERWLRSPVPASPRPADPRVRYAGLAAAALLIVLGVVLGALVDPLLLLAAAAGAFLLWPLVSRSGSAAGGVDEREVHRREYERLGLDGPSGWDGGRVEGLRSELQARALAARREEERALRRGELREELRRHAEIEGELLREKEELARRLGFHPTPEPVELVLLAERIGRWQAAHVELEATQAAARRAEEQQAELAGRLRSRLRRLGHGDLESTGDLAGSIEAFANRLRRLEDARAAITTAEKRLGRLDAERREAVGEMSRIFSVLGLDPDTDETVKDWCAQRKAFLRARDDHHSRHAALVEAARRLAERGGEETLSVRTITDLEAEIDRERTRAAVRDERAREIAAIRARVEDAKRSHGIEEALERIERAREALRQAREKDIRGMIATELVAYVEQATRDRLLPGVFHRAREIFSRITRGRYELRLRREGEPEFVAFDAEDRRERTLSELSSGSRVQLLIAVRVAFVEQQEQGVKLPLILDEVLGNSDDERARAVMEAALELAGEGRQVFYFTAQADEVARWRQLAGAGRAGVEVREIDLAALRGLERAVEIPALPPAAPQGPPAPQGATHAEYGRRLAVPRLDRGAEPLSAVHLWYLTDDPATLHELLRLGPERWGSLETLVRNGGRSLVEEAVLRRLEVAARATEAFLDAARVGVGLPVNRAVLQDSGAVSDVFLDRVATLAEEVHGDGVRLMEQLEAGRVARYGTRSKDTLREYLEEHGYCPSVPPLERDEVRVRVLGRVATELGTGSVRIEEVDRLIERLWMGVGGG